MDSPSNTDMKRVVASMKVMHSPALSLMFLMCAMNSCVLNTWGVNCTTNGLCILVSSLIIPLVTHPLLETICQLVMQFYEILKFYKTLENTLLYNTCSHVCCHPNHFLFLNVMSRLMRLALYFLVGSGFNCPYVLVGSKSLCAADMM